MLENPRMGSGIALSGKPPDPSENEKDAVLE
jgi:hypothetical protein